MDRNYVDGFTDANSFLPRLLMDVEKQAVIIAGLCCVGGWVILQCLIQVILSVLWPFIMAVGVMIFVPSWRKMFATEYLPGHVKSLRGFTRRFCNNAYNTH